jgi:hypothetical protein
MPDDYHPPTPRRNPEDFDLGAIKTDLEFLIERFERFRREQTLKPLYVMVGSAEIVIAWIELFWRHCLRLSAHHAVSWPQSPVAVHIASAAVEAPAPGPL